MIIAVCINEVEVAIACCSSEAGTMLGSSAAMVGRSKATTAPSTATAARMPAGVSQSCQMATRQHQRPSPPRSTGRRARCAAGRTGRRHGRRRRSEPPSAGTGTGRPGRAQRRCASDRRSSSPWRCQWTGRRARKKRGRQRSSDSRGGEERSPVLGICPLRCHRPASAGPPAFIRVLRRSRRCSARMVELSIAMSWCHRIV